MKIPKKTMLEVDVFADRSSLIMAWLLLRGVSIDSFQIREVSKEVGVSLGLVQKVFEYLTYKGWLKADGLRTSKSFSVKNASEIISAWVSKYDLSKKKRFYTYRSSLEKSELIQRIEKSKLKNEVLLCLNSACEAHKRSFTNLKGLELYCLSAGSRESLVKSLQLEPQEYGYEVLLVEPYYKAMIESESVGSWKLACSGKLKATSPLLTFLDLYHFPLRGREQAEHLMKTEFKNYSWKIHE
ncbi:MAG: type IV toxin-antitoxin system AbiEi family antitoxin [Chryseobacterium sp.]